MKNIGWVLVNILMVIFCVAIWYSLCITIYNFIRK
jgi:hypothetical protein